MAERERLQQAILIGSEVEPRDETSQEPFAPFGGIGVDRPRDQIARSLPDRAEIGDRFVVAPHTPH